MLHNTQQAYWKALHYAGVLSPLHDAEKQIVGLRLKCDLRPEPVAKKRKRRRHILHDEDMLTLEISDSVV